MMTFIFILLTALVILTVISYAMLVVASRADERADRMYRKWKEERNEREQKISDR